MISESTRHERRSALFAWALTLSLLLHALLLPALLWVAKAHVPWLRTRTQPRIFVVSSSTRIEHRTVAQRPRPPHRNARAARAARPVPPRPQRRPQQEVAVAPPARRELTQPTPSASPMPQPRRSAGPQTLTQQLAREQAMYQREVAQLRERDNPLSVATIPPRPASAYRREYLDISGINSRTVRDEGIVTPMRRWREGDLHCYYARYSIAFGNGGSESGYIPWPLCYPPDHDVLSLPTGDRVPTIDLIPAADYVVPSGTYLTPFLQWLYDLRAQR